MITNKHITNDQLIPQLENEVTMCRKPRTLETLIRIFSSNYPKGKKITTLKEEWKEHERRRRWGEV